MPPGSRTPVLIRPERYRRKWRRLASWRRRQKVARIRQIIVVQDPERAAESARMRQERHDLKAKTRAKR